MFYAVCAELVVRKIEEYFDYRTIRYLYFHYIIYNNNKLYISKQKYVVIIQFSKGA